MTKIGSFITRNAFDVFYLCILRCSQTIVMQNTHRHEIYQIPKSIPIRNENRNEL